MEEVNKIKALITVFFAALTSLFGILAIPIFVLVVCNVIDYFTAIPAAPKRGEKVNSKKGMAGIFKKVIMYMLIIVASVLDMLIAHTGSIIGITLPFSYGIACIVTIWLALNEMISILENVSDMGVQLPPFLMPIIKYVKSQVEDKTKDVEKNKEE
ncbi:phage holin family protein [Lachnospiraceae bacterium LCP25S3_G4]